MVEGSQEKRVEREMFCHVFAAIPIPPESDPVLITR